MQLGTSIETFSHVLARLAVLARGDLALPAVRCLRFLRGEGLRARERLEEHRRWRLEYKVADVCDAKATRVEKYEAVHVSASAAKLRSD